MRPRIAEYISGPVNPPTWPKESTPPVTAPRMPSGAARAVSASRTPCQDEHQRRSECGQRGAGRKHDEGQLAHAQGAVAHDEAAATELGEEGGNGRQAEIDADPRRIEPQIRDDRGRDHRGQRPAERGEGLLHEHRPEGKLEMGHNGVRLERPRGSAKGGSGLAS